MTKPQSLCLFLMFLLATTTFAVSKDKEEKQKVYNIRYRKDIALSTVQFGAFIYGNQLGRDRLPKHPEQIPNLTPNDVWWFDRGAAKQDPTQADKYLTLSDQFMNGAMYLPLLMYIDPKVRDIWLDYAVLFYKVHSISALGYVAAALPVPRMRPSMYNPAIATENKLGGNNTNSFFSGHASVVATSSFFMVKVYFDLHPDAKNKALWYGLAAIPPIVTGYCRYKAGKHFPTDILTGLAFGTINGILTPELHKKEGKRLKIFPAASSQALGFYAQITL